MSSNAPTELQASLEVLKKYASQSDSHRVEVRDALYAATAEVQTPFEHLFEITFAGPALVMALKTGLDMKLFSKWLESGGGARSTGELAEMTSSDPVLLARLLRHIAAMHKIKEVAKDKYALTPFSEALGRPGISNGINSMLHSTSPAMVHLPGWLSKKGYQNPTNPEDNPYFDLIGAKRSFFEQLALDKDSGRLLDFQETMNMYASSADWVKLYPSERLFDGYDPQRPLIVDAGGGKGFDLNQFLNKHSGLARESLVLQELPSVVQNMEYSLDPSIKVMAHDLYQPQPVKGARAYFTHSVFHGWTDEEAVAVLRHFAGAMTKGYSKLLLNEKVVPSEGATRTVTTSDLYMMSNFASSERTQAVWERLFAESGLKMVNLWQAPIYPEAIIEAELKD